METLQAIWDLVSPWLPSREQLESVAKVAPVGTATIALFAASIAWVSLNTQKLIARRRAATDFFLKTEMDKAMLDAYDEYKNSAKTFAGQHVAVISDTEANGHYRNIRRYLDVVELLAIGIHTKTFDENVCYWFWFSILERATVDCAPVIRKAREEDGAFTYEELVRLQKRWKKRDKWRRRKATQV